MPESGWRTDVREGYRTQVIHIGDAVVTIHSPLLSDAERARREAEVKNAMLNFLEAIEQKGENQNGNELLA